MNPSFMDGFHYFVRTTTDMNFSLSNDVIIMNILFIVFSIIFIMKYRSKSTVLLNKVVILLVIQQISLYTWYMFNDNIGLSDGLPLYLCRITMMSLLILIFLNKIDTKIGIFFLYAGLAGSTAALLVPDLDKYNFPHITNFTFEIGHMCLFYISFYYLNYIRQSLKVTHIIGIILIMHLCINMVNGILGSNYSFLRRSPSIVGMNLTENQSFMFATTVVILLILISRFIHEKIILRQSEFSKNSY